MNTDLKDVKEAINVHNPKTVIVDSYYVNLRQGRAYKTGFNHYLLKFETKE